jgi:hypothetical protein
MGPFLSAIDLADPRPHSGEATDKKNYAERLSRAIATVVANGLRNAFPGITPDADGRRQEVPARTGKGLKKLDVNYSTAELGLGLGVSIKTVNFPDKGSARYTKNFSRADNELRAEAKDYHERQPYSVLVAAIFLPVEACADGKAGGISSFGQAVKLFRHRTNRTNPKNEQELFERVFVAIYEHDGGRRGEVTFFDVTDKPPMKGVPRIPPAYAFDGFLKEVTKTYDARNKPAFEWADD